MSAARNALVRARLGVSTVGTLFVALARSGRWFLVPFVAVLLVSALLLAAVSVIEYVAPFVYTVF